MAWETESKSWVNGNIPPRVAIEDVEGWLRNDPIWARADVIKFESDKPSKDRKRNGSHFCIVRVRGMGELKKRWKGDFLDISSVSGRYVEKWLVQELVDAYNGLADCP